MRRLIDVDALVDALMTYSWRDEDERLIDDADEKREYIKQWLPDLPTVDAAPVVHGQWQWLSSTYDREPCEMRYMCDKCHHETITHGHEPWEKYCPNCGAKMDLEGR